MPNKKYYSRNDDYLHHSHRGTPVNALLSPGEGAVNKFVLHRLQHRQFGLDILSVVPRGRTDKTDKSF